MKRITHWIFQVLIALDQMLNALVGGWADETLSSAAYRMHIERKPWGFMRVVIDIPFRLFFGQLDHCRKAHDDEINRRQSPPSQRIQ